MQNMSCSQLVILPSRLRQIPFSVPGLDADDGPLSANRWRSEPNLENGSRLGSPSSSRASRLRTIRNVDSLGSLDPSLYVDPQEDAAGCGTESLDDRYDDDNIGRVWFSLEYNPDSERLVVHLVQIKNLQSRVVGSANACDPFVRVSLMPDERRWMQSKAKRKTCNPTFDEKFVFQISHRDFDNRAIKLTVFDVDRYRRHVTIGHVVYPLKGHAVDERLLVWRDLERELIQNVTHEASELQLSICYNDSIERLTIGLFSGKNFNCSLAEEPSSSDVRRSPTPSTALLYAKITLSIPKHDMKKKRTTVVKHQIHPVQQLQPGGGAASASSADNLGPIFNESFSFKLPSICTDTACVTITVYQELRTARRDKQIGRVVLGPFMFTRGPELEHWTQMLSCPKQQITRWHKLC